MIAMSFFSSCFIAYARSRGMKTYPRYLPPLHVSSSGPPVGGLGAVSRLFASFYLTTSCLLTSFFYLSFFSLFFSFFYLFVESRRLDDGKAAESNGCALWKESYRWIAWSRLDFDDLHSPCVHG